MNILPETAVVDTPEQAFSLIIHPLSDSLLSFLSNHHCSERVHIALPMTEARDGFGVVGHN